MSLFHTHSRQMPTYCIQMHEESSVNVVSIVNNCSTTSPISKQVYSTSTHMAAMIKNMVMWVSFGTDQHKIPVFQKGKGGASTIQYDVPYKYLISYSQITPQFLIPLAVRKCGNVEMWKKLWNLSYMRNYIGSGLINQCTTTKSNVSSCSLLPLLLERQ